MASPPLTSSIRLDPDDFLSLDNRLAGGFQEVGSGLASEATQSQPPELDPPSDSVATIPGLPKLPANYDSDVTAWLARREASLLFPGSPDGLSHSSKRQRGPLTALDNGSASSSFVVATADPTVAAVHGPGVGPSAASQQRASRKRPSEAEEESPADQPTSSSSSPANGTPAPPSQASNSSAPVPAACIAMSQAMLDKVTSIIRGAQGKNEEASRKIFYLIYLTHLFPKGAEIGYYLPSAGREKKVGIVEAIEYDQKHEPIFTLAAIESPPENKITYKVASKDLAAPDFKGEERVLVWCKKGYVSAAVFKRTSSENYTLQCVGHRGRTVKKSTSRAEELPSFCLMIPEDRFRKEDLDSMDMDLFGDGNTGPVYCAMGWTMCQNISNSSSFSSSGPRSSK